MTTTTNKMFRYQITVRGEGGEFSFVPMTREQVAFWREKGNEALADHLRVGAWGDDGIPPEFQLGCHYDTEESGSGIDTMMNATVVVEDHEGGVCFEKSLSELDLGNFVRVKRSLVVPSLGAFFRTYEKGEQTYELELLEPFDPSKLVLEATGTPEATLINSANYDGSEILSETDIDKEWAISEAELFE